MAGIESHNTQKLNDGVGPTYHRIYSIEFAGSIACAEAAMQELQRNPDQFSPQLLATFEKIRGSSEELRKQDEFQI
ncbi:MAG: hypothetical protein H7326_10995, partial [Bdellovibrionaceae bacterium]|nr:hypothetical protein [Pseudobdellovibrionaceae bacterium]